VFGRRWRAKHDKFASIGLEKYRQIVTVNGRGVTSAAMRTVVVTHARPIVRPVLTAAMPGVIVEKLGHAGLLRIASDNFRVKRVAKYSVYAILR
jgi:hypothetical protein